MSARGCPYLLLEEVADNSDSNDPNRRIKRMIRHSIEQAIRGAKRGNKLDIEWFKDYRPDLIFSFDWCCYVLDVEAEKTRTKILSYLEKNRA